MLRQVISFAGYCVPTVYQKCRSFVWCSPRAEIHVECGGKPHALVLGAEKMDPRSFGSGITKLRGGKARLPEVGLPVDRLFFGRPDKQLSSTLETG